MSVGLPNKITPPSDACQLSLRSPNSYYAYPKLGRSATIPEPAFSLLDAIWKRSIHPGCDVRFYSLQNVFIVKEGLVFDAEGRLYDITQVSHSEDDVEEGRGAVLQAISAGGVRSFTKGILAKIRGCGNYGHFIMEMLPRAWMARTCMALTDWPAIIDSTWPVMESISRQALTAAGFAPDQIIAIDHGVTFFDEIIVVEGLTYHSQYISPFAMQCLDAIAANVAEGSLKAIYAPRYPATWRDFAKEGAIQKRLHRLGVQEVRAVELPFLQQVELFKGADTIVGVAGAALTNIVFCKPGTRVFAFTPCSALEVLFWMIAQARRLDYREIRCEEVGPLVGGLPWDRAIKMSPGMIGKILKAP